MQLATIIRNSSFVFGQVGEGLGLQGHAPTRMAGNWLASHHRYRMIDVGVDCRTAVLDAGDVSHGSRKVQ